jgi:PncC family amidohydrolase
MKPIEKLVEYLVAHKLTLALAESCTGGLLSSLLVNIPGSSAWYKGGVISYSEEAKSVLLSVDQELLRRYGAVSSEIVESMSKGVANVLNSDLSIAISGIAGPSGGTEEKPVGLVWIATRSRDAQLVQSYLFSGSRSEIRQMACDKALVQISQLLKI